MQRPGLVFLIVVAVAVVGGLLYLYGPFGRAPSGDAADVAAAPEARALREVAPPPESGAGELELPPLAESDTIVRDLVRGLSADPVLATSLVPEDLLQRFVAAVHAIASGRSPRRQVAHLEPAGRFRVIEEDGRFVLDPRSFRRYDALADAFVSLDVGGTVEIFGNLEPLMDQAYVDLGEEGTRFRPVLIQAIDVLLAAPAPEGRLELIDRVQRFEFRDRELEGLSEAQKHLVRMGPGNVVRVQGMLRALRAGLEEDPSLGS